MTEAQKEAAVERRRKAVVLVADGKGSDEIAKELGLCRRTITTWRGEKQFQADVHTHKNAWRGKARNEGIADKDTRLRYANDEHKRLRAVMLARAVDPQFAGVPGGETGLLTVTYKMQSMGEGKGSEAKPEFQLDAALLERTQALRDEVAIAKGEIKLKPKADTGANVVNINILMAELDLGMKYVREHRNDTA